MSERIGDWMLTFTGKQFWPLAPQAEDICIEDIAHALAHLCRFNGHVQHFYSVAQHSVLVSVIVERRLSQTAHPLSTNGSEGESCKTFHGRPLNELLLKALLHDGPEAYIGDMVRPLKQSMPDYRAAESEIWDALCRRFGMTYDLPPCIKEADNIALMTERRDITVPTAHKWSLQDKYPPCEEKIYPYMPQAAKTSFLHRFEQLGGKLQ
jgi:uncharacterized protein